MTPAFEIIADGEDVTAKIADRLVSLTVTDEDGQSADSLTLVLDDRDARLELPETGALLRVSLGFAQASLNYIGTYAVDRIKGDGLPSRMIINATAANMTGNIRAPQTRAWSNVTLGEIVATIAAEAGLGSVVSEQIAAIPYAFVAQVAESNLNLLMRLTKPLDATAKPAGSSLIVVARDNGINAAGDPIEPVIIDVASLSRWSWQLNERETYATVEAEWGEPNAAKTNKVTVGSGAPTRRLRNVFSSLQEAQRAATSELAMANRQRFKIECEMAGFEPALFAGGTAQISGIRQEIDGTWLLRSVTHTLDAALTTTWSGERSAQ